MGAIARQQRAHFVTVCSTQRPGGGLHVIVQLRQARGTSNHRADGRLRHESGLRQTTVPAALQGLAESFFTATAHVGIGRGNEIDT